MPHEPTKPSYLTGARKQAGLTLTPGLQSVIDKINSNRAQQEEMSIDEGGPFGIGKAFRSATGFSAKGFRRLGDGVTYVMKGLSLTNEYVSKPLLGFGLAVGEEGPLEGPGLRGTSIDYYKKHWEEANIPAPIKFAAEFAADPLVWTGVGAWKTPTIKFAARLAEAAETAGAAEKTNFIAKALRTGSAELSFSKEARTAIETLAKGGTKLKKADFEVIARDAVKSGLLPKAQAESMVANLLAGQKAGLSFSALRPGWMARLASPTRLSRIFGPVDVFAEAAWSIPFRGAGLVLKPIAEPTGRLAFTAIDRLGQGFPIRQFTWFGSKVGPKVFHDVHDAAKGGKLMTWLLRRTDEAIDLEAARTVQRVSLGIDQAASVLKMDPYEVMRALRLEDQKVVHSLTAGEDVVSGEVSRTIQKLMDDDALDALYGGIRALSDDQFIKLTAVETDEALRKGLSRSVKNWMVGALKGPELFEKTPHDLTVFNRFWGWTEGLVNKWRPVVTSLNPSFQFLNIFSDLTERGGSGIVWKGSAALADDLIKHGIPADLVSSADDNLGSLFWRYLQGDKEAVEGLSQFGIKVGKNDPSVVKGLKALTTHADHRAQMAIIAREGGNEWFRLAATADVDDPMIRVRQLVEEIDNSGLNPEAINEIKRAMPQMLRSPKKMSRVFSEMFSYENITKEHLMSGEAFRSMPEEWRTIWSQEYDKALNITASRVFNQTPVFEGQAWRAPSGFSPTGTAGDVIRHERNELGNVAAFRGITKGMRDVLDDLPADSVVWVTKTKKAASRFKTRGRPIERVSLPEGSRVIAADGEGGFLVLKGDRIPSTIQRGWDPLTAARIASDRADPLLAGHAGTAMRQAYSEIAQIEKVRDEMFAAAGFTGLRGIRKEQAEVMRRTMLGYAAAVDTFAPQAAEKFTRERIPSVALAARQVDAMVDTHIAQAAASRGRTSMHILPTVEMWNQRVTGKIAKNLDTIADALPKYRQFMQAGNMDRAAKELRRMSKAHGDFTQFREMADLPLPGVLEEQFRATGERIWAQYLGRKYELADHLIALMDSGAMHPNDIAGILNKAESEVFAHANLPALRTKWAGKVAQWSGNAGEVLPARVQQLPLTPQELQAHRRLSKDFLQGQYQKNLKQYADNPVIEAYRPEFEKHLRSLGLTPDDIPPLTEEGTRAIQDQAQSVKVFIGEALAAERHLGELGGASALTGLRAEEQRLAALLDPNITENVIGKTVRQIEHVPQRAVEQFYLDMQNNYDTIGRAAIDSVRRLLPDQYTPFLIEQSARVRAEAIKLAANGAQNQKGAQLAQEMIHKFGTLVSRDKQLQIQASKLYREALHTKGLEVMRQRMVDYQNTNNIHKVISAFLPFASFQLHLPGYLARTFMERPGVIASLNHFAQEANKNHGVTGGMLFGGGFVFAPQLRFSYLPLLAGNNFVNADDHPLNQINDMLSAFGFSPGPNIQIMGDIGNRFADQLGINQALGVGQAAPEFRGGLLPQWRFVQDITAIMGIDGGNGLSVPFLGPSADVREREVRRVLAGRLSNRVEQFKKDHGRDPYPDEVTAMREFVWQNELTAARQEVAEQDLPEFFLPGVRIHDPEYLRIRDKASTWMKLHGVEDVTPKNVATKYRSLNKLQKASLLQTVPEFADILSIPPFQESGQEKQVRGAREAFFKNRDLIMADTMREQRKLDTALESGAITPKQYRDMRSDLRTRMTGALNGLEMNPDYKPFMTRERMAPTDPGETAYMDFLKLEPQDLNGNGIIDESDMKVYFNARREYVKQQPSWVKDYIRNRQEVDMTPTEIEFTRAQSTLNDYFDIPKYLGMTQQESDIADAVLERVDAAARAMPGRADRTRILLSIPDISPQERVLALRAMASPRNPARVSFWMQHQELEMFYPDLRPGEVQL